MSEDFDTLKKQKDAILAREKEFSVCIGMDALRICLGLEPKTYTTEQIMKHMRLMSKPTDGKD